MKNIIGLFIFVILIGMVSADFTFDNSKSFDKNVGRYGTITIKNAFGLGSDLVEYTLISNSEFCLTNCYAEGTVNLFVPAKLFDNFEFKNLDTGGASSLSFKSYISNSQESVIVDVPVYEEVCTPIINGQNGSVTNECISILKGTAKENVTTDIWKEYAGEELTGFYKWKIEAQKSPQASIDWVAVLDKTNIGEFKTDEWAFWLTSFNQNLLLYYTLNETSGNNVLDSVTGNYNGTEYTADWTPIGCLIGNCLNMTNDDRINVSTSVTNKSMYLFNGTLKNFTVSFWINTSDITQLNAKVLVTDGAVGADDFLFSRYAGGGLFTVASINNGGWQFLTDSTFAAGSNNRWTHFVYRFTNDGTGTGSLWINGTEWYTDASYSWTLNPDIVKDLIFGFPAIAGSGGFNGLIDEIGWWNRYLTNSEITDLYNNGLGLTYSATETITTNVTLITPEANLNTVNRTIVYNCNATSVGGLYNLSLLINNSVTGLTVSSSVQNTTPVQTNLSLSLTIGYVASRNDTWSCQARQLNDISVNATFKSYEIKSEVENSQTYNSTTYESSFETFKLNLSASNISTISAELIYNDTTKGNGTKTEYGTTGVVFSRTVSVINLDIAQNIPFYWRIFDSSTNTSHNSTNTTQRVAPMTFNICNNTLTYPYVNYTFKNEINSSVLSASIPTSSWAFWIGNQSMNNTLIYSSLVQNSSYAFCFDPQNRTVTTKYTLQYEAVNYPQRIFSEQTTFTNSTTNKTLYLLESGDGIYITFQVVNAAEEALQNVFVNATKSISGTTTLISNGFTDAAGAITFWLSPDFSHTFCFEKEGFDLFCTSLFPTQSTYTVTLGEIASVTNSTSQGIITSINPKTTTTLSNNTVYQFNFTISTDYWTITSFGFTLRNASGTIFNTTSSSANGGTLNVGLNTENQTRIFMDYFYVTNGNYTNATVSWYIEDLAGSGYSIRFFFERLGTYLTAGMFGLDSFGLNMIIFLIIFISTGVLSYKFGLNSPIAISALALAFVFLFDVGLSLIELPVGAIEHFPTFFIAVIFVAMAIREYYK